MAYRPFPPPMAARGGVVAYDSNSHDDDDDDEDDSGSAAGKLNTIAKNPNHNNSTASSSDFFSPISMAFFGGKVSLPRSHDTSWIGARQSPIPSFDNEDADNDDDDHKQNYDNDSYDDDDDEKLTLAYHRALHESLQAADFVAANERTSLLSLQQRRGSAASSQQQQQQQPLHPLWDGATQEERGMREKAAPFKVLWGDVLILISGIYWVATTAYDAYYFYHSYTKSILQQEDSEESSDGSISFWSTFLRWLLFIWDTRSYSLLLYAGAFAPDRILLYSSFYSELWRIPVSLLLCASLPQWILLALAWRLVCGGSALHRARTSRYAWMGTFCASAIVGQLWMMAWDKNRVSNDENNNRYYTTGASTSTTGDYYYQYNNDDDNVSVKTGAGAIAACATWGMCGVLTAVGIHRPDQRAVLFLPPIFGLLLALWEQPFNSVYGVSGASFLGWGLAVVTTTTAMTAPAVMAATTSASRRSWNSIIVQQQQQKQQQQQQQKRWERWEPTDYLKMVLVLAMFIAPLLSIAFGTPKTIQ